MNQQTGEKHGITWDKLSLIKYSRKKVFVKMLCNPVFILVYWYFCRTLYKFCMYGGVKKRGIILAACMIFFLGYLICYYVRIHKIKVAENLPEKMKKVCAILPPIIQLRGCLIDVTVVNWIIALEVEIFYC